MALNRDEKSKIISDFGQSGQDTGSTEVQVALLSKTINELTEHCKNNPQDFSSKRGLLKKVCQRRGLLRYLERADHERYKKLIDKLGLRK